MRIKNWLRRPTITPEGIPALRRGLPWVKSTIRVTRERWRNWSRELTSTPKRLYCDDAGGPWRSPRTLEDLQTIVREARRAKTTIRVFGSSHSWAKLVPNDDGFIVDNRMIGATDGMYRPTIRPAPDGSGKAWATVSPGVLSGEFEEWLWSVGYTLPASAVEDVFSMGGMAATATHGTGMAHGTLSDMVVEMTFVDGLGVVRRWSRETATEDEFAAMQCGLGCLGLVYDITFEVLPRYTVLYKAEVVSYDSLFADTDEARTALRDLHETHDSVEFFWWPLRFSGLPLASAPEINPDLWVLTTQKNFSADQQPRSPFRRFLHLQVLDMSSMMFCGALLDLGRGISRLASAPVWVSCFTNLWVNARSGAFTMPQYDANHFVNAGGVEFVRVLATEWSIPFRRCADVQRADGYERVRRAFADLHDLTVEAFRTYPSSDLRATPITTAIEMRTTAASRALLSPGYQPATPDDEVFIATPEIVTHADHPAWTEFAHRANLALTANPRVFGDQVRTHLAKLSLAFPHPDHPVGGMRDYLTEQYRAAGTWERFLAVRQAVDPDGIFLNPYLREWFFPAEDTA